MFDFTLGRRRDGPTQFLGDYGNTLLADAFGGCAGVVVSNQMRRALAGEALRLYRQLYAIEARGAANSRPPRGWPCGGANRRR